MKSFSLILSSLTIALGLMYLGSSCNSLDADPSDDLSLTLAYHPETPAYRLMSEKRIAEIFVDQLDLFPVSQAPKLARYFLALCRQYRFDPAFVLSLIDVESGFRTRAVSPMGAVGLMQLMPATAQVVQRDILGEPHLSGQASSERALKNPYVNLKLGIAYLAYLRDHYRGRSPYFLVAAYNVGPARMDELISRKSFKPVTTKKYYEAIRRGVPGFRHYRRTDV